MPILLDQSSILARYNGDEKGEGTMLWTIILILLIMWALGIGFGGLGPLIHILLAVALIVLIVQLVTGRRPVV
ncbi:MAG: lmo0937 family membrane protein [Pyrinomonadaceae bacterium]